MQGGSYFLHFFSSSDDFMKFSMRFFVCMFCVQAKLVVNYFIFKIMPESSVVFREIYQFEDREWGHFKKMVQIASYGRDTDLMDECYSFIVNIMTRKPNGENPIT